MKINKKALDRIYSKAEAEMMWNMYDLIDINFNAEIVADAIPIVGIPLKNALQSQLLEIQKMIKKKPVNWDKWSVERQLGYKQFKVDISEAIKIMIKYYLK